MARIVAVANQKGGVGKTTTAVNLAAALAVAEKPTLVVDMDPQANASSALGVYLNIKDRSLYDALLGATPVEELVRGDGIRNLDVLPSSRHLIGAEIELIDVEDRETVLARALSGLDRPYEYVLVDCPPSLGLLTLNALTAADSVLVPVQCEYLAMEGLGALLDTIDRVQGRFNSRLEVEGILLTMHESRLNLTRQVEEEIRGHFGRKVYDTVISRNVRLSEAPSHGKPIILYDARSRGCQQYMALASEFLGRQRKAGRKG